VTLTFSLDASQDQPLTVNLANVNPDPLHLVIVQSSITGGATYSPSVGVGGPEGVVWDGTLNVGSMPQEVTFQMRVLSIPANAMAAGLPEVNSVAVTDVNAGTLPIATSDQPFTLRPLVLNLPVVGKNGPFN
jgi:hypothetical protein